MNILSACGVFRKVTLGSNLPNSPGTEVLLPGSGGGVVGDIVSASLLVVTSLGGCEGGQSLGMLELGVPGPNKSLIFGCVPSFAVGLFTMLLGSC